MSTAQYFTLIASGAAPDRQIDFTYLGGPSGLSQTWSQSSPQGRGADGPARRPFRRWRRHEVQTGRAGLISLHWRPLTNSNDRHKVLIYSRHKTRPLCAVCATVFWPDPDLILQLGTDPDLFRQLGLDPDLFGRQGED